MAVLWSKIGLFLSLAGALIPLSSMAEEQEFRIGSSVINELKYQPGFTHFDYVNTNAPKGGDLRLSTTGTFDTFNPLLEKGEVATGLALVYDTLMKPADDEVLASYGLLAEGLSYPPDVSSATFRLRKEAKWADGQPVTPEDVVFSFDKSKELNPLNFNYYSHVVKAEKTGDRDVTFTFDEKNNRELPNILGQLTIVPKHWWEAPGPDGKPRDISKTTLEPVMGSGPYKIADFSPGATTRFELRDDYWGKDLNVNVGQNNFRNIIYTYFGDRDVEFEAFRAANVDYRQENQASRWATAYDFPAVKDGRVKREEPPNALRATGIMQAFVPNMRRDLFKDIKVREALNYAFDFEDLNRNLAFNAFERIDSFFWNTELASSGLPQGRELEILQGLKDKVPPEVFTTPYTNPVAGDPQKIRDNLRKSIALFKEAGWELKGNRMVNVKTGQPMSFEILLSNPSFERSVLPYANNLKKIGVDARLRTVDASQYTNRVRSFDYDMIWGIWGETMNPGNEQADYWGSQAANQPGSRNYAGIADPAVDALVRMIIFAPNRDEQVASIKAMDRVLLANHYVVPLFYSRTSRLAYWNRITRPTEFPAYGLGFPEAWWSTSAK
ncbi:extracellular solute-binding protein [Rhizobium leguminosarum]|uniref:extracellular solute-binding protein n=1 Tax=Rhizobium leguminosarum TaxID=384 RepID=UPI0010326FAD|nr:extracellular solute-binding protein [Rhizobium leguminosarum]NKJ99769.1 ABC transporter substrate-binding protein [Rhizobium leguminosarum bv. viciae]QIO73334.1 ABC transporter substrate-binding protein [Rhizobium leguminosarum bv. trifolii]QIO80353.1 ABC transporter substrate-binding protein [Rhizobium leguminosarum bv. trifolii]TAU23158.1 ABC transporter substrate-binding protein [Rhizobium leguminosarum]TAU43153.1 ABC transporter substrate-binding protein [Rhizobium leguminosarum]